MNLDKAMFEELIKNRVVTDIVVVVGFVVMALVVGAMTLRRRTP